MNIKHMAKNMMNGQGIILINGEKMDTKYVNIPHKSTCTYTHVCNKSVTNQIYFCKNVLGLATI